MNFIDLIFMSILTLPVITDYGLWEGEEGTSIGLLHRRNALCGSRAEPVQEGWLRSVQNHCSSPFFFFFELGRNWHSKLDVLGKELYTAIYSILIRKVFWAFIFMKSFIQAFIGLVVLHICRYFPYHERHRVTIKQKHVLKNYTSSTHQKVEFMHYSFDFINCIANLRFPSLSPV